MMLLSSAAAVSGMLCSSEHAEVSQELKFTGLSGSRETGNHKHTSDYPHCFGFVLCSQSIIHSVIDTQSHICKLSSYRKSDQSV